jgi:hypothetical protein
MGLKIAGKVTARQTDQRRDRGMPPARTGWPDPAAVKRAGRVSWNSKTMHHPAFRIGEIKHGRS